MERVDIEIGERARPRDAVDVAGFESGILDGPLGRFRTDLTRSTTRRLRVGGFADPGDGNLAPDVGEFLRAAPVGHRWEGT